MIRAWLAELDELLRGRSTSPELLIENRPGFRIHRLLGIALLMGAIYGFFMGWFSVFNRTPTEYQQIFASMAKLPALFLLTLLVTLPSLYVFSALLGCQLSCSATLRLLLSAVVVNLVVAASFGTILGFFTLSTASYPFMVVLNVALLGVAGTVGLGFLLRSLRRLAAAQVAGEPLINGPLDASLPAHANGDRTPVLPSPAQPPWGRNVIGSANAIFRIWLIIYALVGVQMGWLLRPFVGSPDLPFRWFRPRSGNFFQSLFQSLGALTEAR